MRMKIKWFPVGILIITLICSLQGSSLINLGLEYTPNIDLHLLLAQSQEESLHPLTERYYMSLHNVTPTMSTSASKTIRKDDSPLAPKSTRTFKSVRSILKLTSVPDILGIMRQIGSIGSVLRSELFPSLLVIWPDMVTSDQGARALLNSPDFVTSSSGFNIASELLLAFPIKSTTTPTSITNSTTDSSSEFLFYEIYMINGQLIVMSMEKGVVHFRCRNCRGPAIRRHNFHGLTLNISGVEDADLNDDLHFQKTGGGDLIFSPEGFSARILAILQNSLNFSVKAVYSSEWGRVDPGTGEWVGSVKDVADGKANLGISITIMRPNRAEMISFLPAADENAVSAFFHTPNLSAVRDIFARPFKADLWAAVFSTWIVLAFFMILFSVIRKRYDMHLTEDGTPEPDFTQDSFIWALATACQQGWDEHPVAGSLRTIFISGSFTGVVAYAGYSAAIVSTLSLRVDPIQNPDQLLKSSLHVGIREGFISELLRQNGTNDIMTAFQEKLKASPKKERYLKVAEGYEHLAKHPYAFISTRDNLYDTLKVISNDSTICNLRELQLLKHGFPLGHFIAKNSPYKEFFRYLYVTIREPGISWKLRGNYTYTRRCLEASDSAGNALGPNDVFTAFMILSAGFLLAFTFLAVEKLVRVGNTFSYMQ